jgi:plasmid stability protein
MSGISVRNVSLDDEGVVEITVPAAEIQYVSVDNEATQILDRETGLFTKGDPRLETDARQVAEEVLVQAAVDEGVLADAEDNARQILTDFLLGLGYRDVVVEFAG